MKSNVQSAKSGHPLLIGLHAARANVVPGLIVQAAMVAVVMAYYFYEPARTWMAHLALLKQRWGYGFTFVSSAMAGGVMPELLTVVVFQRCRMRRENLTNLIFSILFWGVQGMTVDTLYRFQAQIFGAHVNFLTVMKKMMVDQFIYNPIFAMPWTMLIYEWKGQGYCFAGMSRALTGRFYKERTLPAMVATWGVWIPVVSLVYSLPSLLQIPLFSLALTFWVILFTWISRKQQQS